VCAVACLLLFAGRAYAEPPLARDTVWIEGAGAGYVYSGGYEHVFADRVALRAGFTYVSLSNLCGAGKCGFVAGGGLTDPIASLILVPITVSWVGFRHGRHVFELGAGGTVAYSFELGLMAQDGTDLGGYLTAFAGYRYHTDAEKGFQFRIGVMALAGNGFGQWIGSDADTYGVMPWGYVSVGTSF
jgi:hypothetical protein